MWDVCFQTRSSQSYENGDNYTMTLFNLQHRSGPKKKKKKGKFDFSLFFFFFLDHQNYLIITKNLNTSKRHKWLHSSVAAGYLYPRNIVCRSRDRLDLSNIFHYQLPEFRHILAMQSPMSTGHSILDTLWFSQHQISTNSTPFARETEIWSTLKEKRARTAITSILTKKCRLLPIQTLLAIRFDTLFTAEQEAPNLRGCALAVDAVMMRIEDIKGPCVVGGTDAFEVFLVKGWGA